MKYPETPRVDVSERIHGVTVQDPYRWLEVVDEAPVQTWMDAQDSLARDYLNRLPMRDVIAERLRSLSYYDATWLPTKRGQRYFYLRSHADKEKPVLYVRQDGEAGERMLIDPNHLSGDGNTSLGGYWPSRDGRYLAYKLKENNADAATMYLMDVDTGESSKRDIIPGAKYASAAWTPDGAGFYYTKLPQDSDIPIADLPGHAHIRYHALGTDVNRDPIIFPANQNPQSFVTADVSSDGEYLLVTVAHGWNSTDVYYRKLDGRKLAGRSANPGGTNQHVEQGSGDATDFRTLVKGASAIYSVKAWDGAFYVLTDEQAPNYRIFRVDPMRASRTDWREIVPESNDVINGMRIVGGKLVLTYLHNAYHRMAVHDLDGSVIRELTLPGIGSIDGVSGSEDAPEAYYMYHSYTTPPQIFQTTISDDTDAPVSLWSQVDIPIESDRFVVDQVWYPSRDGTKVSMFIIRRKDIEPNGQNQTILYGYGGFNISLKPSFSPMITAWIEQGGVYAVANLRGGGEYGEDWHRAGMLGNKQNTFDDFLAAARYLQSSGWTNAERLAISGGSNGGLLVGAAMTQAPSLFRAVVCAVPLLDMVRYHQFGSGKTWIPEYGSSEDNAEFSVLYQYSPYHRVTAGVSYPALLMLSADNDDRVDPMHARKFTAAIQWASNSGLPAIMRIERNAGHGGADMVRQRVAREADSLAFLLDILNDSDAGAKQ